MKSIGRPAGCTENGLAFGSCISEETPLPASVIATVDPNTLSVLARIELEESVGGRLALGQFEGQDYIYVGGADDIYRVALEGSDLRLDDWRFRGFSTPGQASPSAVVVMGDWIVFQMNASPGMTPMTVHAVSQADASVRANRDPFGPGGVGVSFVPSSLTADPDSLRIYSQDTGRGQIGCLELIEAGGAVELVERWVVDQTTLHHLTLIGPPESRVLVSTDAPGALMGLRAGNFTYDEVLVWRSAATGDELARSEVLPAMAPGSPVTPGFASTIFYVGAAGEILELRSTGLAPVCE